MNKKFFITASVFIAIPFEEGLLDGKINCNHLMYMAQKYLDDNPDELLTHKLKYSFDYRDDNKEIAISVRRNDPAITIEQAEINKKLIHES